MEIAYCLPLRSFLLCPSLECGASTRISSYSDAGTIILVGVDGRISPTLGSALHSPTPTRVFVVSIDGTEGHQPSSALVVLRFFRHDNSGGIGGVKAQTQQLTNDKQLSVCREILVCLLLTSAASYTASNDFTGRPFHSCHLCAQATALVTAYSCPLPLHQD